MKHLAFASLVVGGFLPLGEALFCYTLAILFMLCHNASTIKESRNAP